MRENNNNNSNYYRFSLFSFLTSLLPPLFYQHTRFKRNTTNIISFTIIVV